MKNIEYLKSLDTCQFAHVVNHCLPTCEEICKEGLYRCYETCKYRYGDEVIEEWLNADENDSYDDIWDRIKK